MLLQNFCNGEPPTPKVKGSMGRQKEILENSAKAVFPKRKRDVEENSVAADKLRSGF